MGDWESALSTVEDVLNHIRRKRRLTTEEWEDFHGWAWEKLAKSDYAPVRKFEGRGTLTAYLAVVLNRYLLDYRVQKWGKWRPSVTAKKLGPDAVDLEFLIQRDRCTISEAVQTLRVDRGCALSEDELHALANRLPLRRKNWTTAEDWLEEIPSPRPSPEGEMHEQEADAHRAQVEQSLTTALEKLGIEERVALKMHYEQQLKLNEVARALGRDPKRFYRDFDRILRRLRLELENQGVDAGSVGIAFPETDLSESATAFRP